ncbi:MAG: EAL domain-containing protein [Paracoccaceae bacterium]|nr:EAL domain-containing protein [Paracoccaceae bacterium]
MFGFGYGIAVLGRGVNFFTLINMSVRSIGSDKWLEILAFGWRTDSTLKEWLILEITEHSAISVPELVMKSMRNIQKQGISFAPDDFGSGSTLFRPLNEFRFGNLKID